MRRARNLFTWGVFYLAVAVAALILVPSVFGFDRYVIETGSMTGTIDRGSVVYSKPADAKELQVGDIITYQPPASSGVHDLVTHRIVEKKRRVNSNGKSEYVFRTKGDANDTADPWTFTLENGAAALEKAHLPYIGYVYLALAIPWVRILLITLPALAILVLTAISLWRDAGREVEEERERRRLAQQA